jgi:uncharacterized metal-binding protein YceD (DUF177 family)
MVSFRFNEIPKGVSEELLDLEAEELGVEDPGISRVRVRLTFNKQDENLRIQCAIGADALLVCDRSLDRYETELDSSYEVVFQLGAKEELEELSGTLRRLDPSQNIIDITRELRDTVLLSIPVKKLHPRYVKDGKITGFEASFGNKENETGHDPRWDALSELKQRIEKN